MNEHSDNDRRDHTAADAQDDSDAAPRLDRRALLGRGGALALGLLVGGASGLHAEEITAPPATTPLVTAPPAGTAPAVPQSAPNPAKPEGVPPVPVGCAVIGLGEQGRELLGALQYVPGANVVWVCDTYEQAHKKALELFPKAKATADYKQVLDDKAVQAVWVATPSHLHRQIVVDALAAGKHVYCEAPLAHTIDDARVIARAAQAAAPKLIFHTGLQQRTNPQHNHVLQFVRTGALANVAACRSQWHKKTSWRRKAPTDERQNALNWRLRRDSSPGLMGEIGIHQADVGNWFLKGVPTAVSGFGGTLAWNDGRDVPDTVQCIFEYPQNVHLSYDATLANSFDGAYELFQGTNAAVLLRDGRAWMFKEADAPALGWEVYAYKEKLGDETGIALVADATKLLAAGKEPGKNRETDPTKGALYYAADVFLASVRDNKPTVCGPVEGFQATVTALVANQAVLTASKITITPEMLAI